MKQSVDGNGRLVPGLGLDFHVDNSDEELIFVEVLPEVQYKHQKKKEFPVLVRKSGRLMSSESISI